MDVHLFLLTLNDHIILLFKTIQNYSKIKKQHQRQISTTFLMNFRQLTGVVTVKSLGMLLLLEIDVSGGIGGGFVRGVRRTLIGDDDSAIDDGNVSFVVVVVALLAALAVVLMAVMHICWGSGSVGVGSGRPMLLLVIVGLLALVLAVVLLLGLEEVVLLIEVIENCHLRCTWFY